MDEDKDNVGMTDSIVEQAIRDILAERQRQDEKWGEQNHSPFAWTTILVEEVGEFAQAALHYKFGGPAAINLRAEMIHVAAVALQIIECIDRDNWSWTQ